jgi:hypothetical protein
MQHHETIVQQKDTGANICAKTLFWQQAAAPPQWLLAT